MAKKRRKRGALPTGLRNRGGKLYYYFRLNGAQFTGKTDLEASDENYPQALLLRQEALERAKLGVKTSGSFEAVAEEAFRLRDVKDSTRDTYANTLVHMVAYFGPKTLIKDITPADIERYMSWRRENNIAPDTIRNGLIILRGIFNHGIKARIIRENPVEGVKVPKARRRKRVITREEEARYLAYAWDTYPKLAAFVTIMLDQGMRPGEILDIKVGDVIAGENGSHKLWIAKSKTEAGCRWVYLTKRSLEALELIRPESGYYFTAETSGKPWPESNRTLCHNRVLAVVSPDDHWPIYALRHTFATRGMQAGIHPLVLAYMMGHSSPVITEIYQHASESDVRAAMMTLESDTISQDKAGQSGTGKDKDLNVSGLAKTA